MNKVIKNPLLILDYATQKVSKNDCQLPLIDCGLGSSPYNPPYFIKSLKLQLKELKNYQKDGFSQKITDLIKQRFCLKNSFISLNGGGSITTLDFIFNQLVKEKTVVCIGPFFPNTLISIKKAGLPSIILQPKLSSQPKQKLQLLVKHLKENIQSVIVYIDNPNNPTGQFLAKNKIENLIKQFPGNLFVIDEAFADFLPDCQSAVNLVEKFENIIVVRSFSKGLGLAGLRVGLLVTHQNNAQAIKSRELIFSVNLPAQIILEKLLTKKKRLNSFLQIIRRKNLVINKYLIKNLIGLGLEVLPTNLSTTIITVKGPKNLFEKLSSINLITEPGLAFSLTHQKMDNSLVRLRTPKSIKECREIITRCQLALKDA